VSSDSNHYKFTGKERDAETGYDYFGARYYGSNTGRWMSPDWANGASAVPYADFSDPQTLNLYAYVRNNPIANSDPIGHNIIMDGLEQRDVWGASSGITSGDSALVAAVELNTFAASLAAAAEAAAQGQGQGLSDASEQAILSSPLTGPQAIAFEDAVTNAGMATGVDPNVLVGMAFQESRVGVNMNANGAAKGLYGVEKAAMKQINKMFGLHLVTGDLTSLSAASMAKVSLGVASLLQHYVGVYSNGTDPRGIDVALSVWRVGIGRTQANIRAGNFWDYVDPHRHESVAHYVDTVEGFQ
jgi:RHS repeat-associated protein